jgi:nitrogen fixation protein FixH
MTRPFTGRRMAAILVAFFAVIVVVNFTMARFASATFGGIVVENSYVASQEFNRWLEQAEEARALGWSASVERDDAGRVEVTLSGAPAGVALTAEARHPLGREPDQALTFVEVAPGHFVSLTPLPAGRWTVRLIATDGTDTWRQEEKLS